MAKCAEHDFNCARVSYDVCYEQHRSFFFLHPFSEKNESLSEKFLYDGNVKKETSQFFKNTLAEVQNQVKFCGELNFGKSFENVTFTSEGDFSASKVNLRYNNVYLSFESSL